MSVKKYADDIERGMEAAQLKQDRNQERLDAINKTLVSGKAGIEYICEKLTDVKGENGEPNILVTDETMVDALI